MALLGFKDRFVPLIESGAKRHTIRAERPDIRVGMRLDLYARPRQKGMRLIFRAPCTHVEEIKIAHDRQLYGTPICIAINRQWLTMSEKIEFARADGFKDFDDLCAWWNKTRSIPFEGIVIHWDFEKRSMTKDVA